MTATPPPLGRRGHLALAVVVGGNVMGLTLVVPVVPSYAVEFDVPLAAAASMLSIFAGARFLARPLGGMFGDRRGPRLAAITGAAAVAGGAVVAALAPSLPVLLAGRALQGIGSGIFGTATGLELIVRTPPSDLGRGTAVFQAGILAGASLGPLLGGVLAELGTIRTPFWAHAVMAAAVGTGAALIMRGGPRTLPAGAARRGLVRPAFAGVMFMGFSLFFMRAGGRNTLLPAFADEILGFGPGGAGLVVSLASVTAVLAMPLAGRWADVIGRRPMAVGGMIGSAATIAAYGLVDTLGPVILISIVGGFAVGVASVALPTIVGDLAPPGAEGLASGVYRMANDVGWMTGPLVIGLLADRSAFAWGFAASGAPMLVAGLAFLLAPETGPARRRRVS